MIKNILNILNDIAYISWMEFRTLIRDLGVMIFLFGLPLGYPVLYGLIYNPEVPHDVPVAVVDDSRSGLSRKYCRMLDATPDAHVVEWAANMDEAKDLMARNRIFGILYIGRDFSRNINRGEQANVTLFCNMSSLLEYRTLLTANTNTVAAFNQILQEEQLIGATVKQQSMSVSPVKSASLALYNPLSGFATFIMPAIEVIVIQQSLLLALGMIAGTERDQNPHQLVIPYDRHYFGTFRVLMGKTLCFLTISILTTFWTMVVIPYIFHLPQLGTMGDILLFTVPFILSSIFLGLTLSFIMRGREMPMLFFVFFSVPLLFISGIVWPWSNMPVIWKWFGLLIPSTSAIRGFMQITSCGSTLADVGTNYFTLWCLTAVYYISAFWVVRYQINQSLKSPKITPSSVSLTKD